MFELREAKRVRRDELDTSDREDEAFSETEPRYHELQAKLNALMESQAPAAKSGQPLEEKDPYRDEVEMADESEEEAYEFRLFDAAPVTKVVLESDELPKGEGGLVRPGRPLSYYMVTGTSAEQKEKYQIAAVTGDDVLARSQGRFWSCEFPWRVTTICVNKKAGGAVAQPSEDEASVKRKRPGKKRRIAIHTRERKKAAKVAAKAAQLAAKEDHIKDKKKRMNRAKKLRKRAKARELKAANGETGDGEDASGDESSGA
ncbi:hypothetical protein B0I35DRAFT_432564, partial [Stachybotrys elegans]